MKTAGGDVAGRSASPLRSARTDGTWSLEEVLMMIWRRSVLS